jgi:hypothetical protein
MSTEIENKYGLGLLARRRASDHSSGLSPIARKKM